jgi:hypothetical protein
MKRAMSGQKRIKRIEMMIVLGSILLIVGLISRISILWTIGLAFLTAGVVFLILGEKSRAAGGRRYRYQRLSNRL